MVEVDIPGHVILPSATENVAVIDELNTLGKLTILLVVPNGDIKGRVDHYAHSIGFSFGVDFSLVVGVFFTHAIRPGSKAPL